MVSDVVAMLAPVISGTIDCDRFRPSGVVS